MNPAKPLTSADQLSELTQRLQGDWDADKPRLRVCITGCRAYGALEVSARIAEEIAERGLEDQIELIETGCHGFCSQAPVMEVDPFGYFYQGVSVDDIPAIIDSTLDSGAVVEHLLYTSPDGDEPIEQAHDVPFYALQHKTVLRNCGQIDPREIEHSLVRGGYSAVAKVLSEMDAQAVIDEVKQAGLRGRGGAGFPTGVKWQFCSDAEGERKYLICNADEGDPGAFMDRAVLEGDPHAVIEGMIIAAHAIGADEGIIYVRTEYPIAIEHLTIALAQARELGLLGESILGTDMSFDIRIVEGAGAFVCGEETALMASIEGKRGNPMPRPPYPAQSGLFGMPTNINNVETLANIAAIINDGAEAFAALGTDKSKGTKVFALAGDTVNTGLVEVPMGITLRDIVEEIGGGIADDHDFKAAQIGGPSGGCVPEKFLDTPIDYDSLEEVGAIMGSGGMVIIDDTTCIVDLARFFLDFCQKESCGKCTPCRIGVRKMYEMVDGFTRGLGKPGDIEELQELAEVIKTASLCALGKTAANPALSALRHFREEFDAHVAGHTCPVGQCTALTLYTVNAEACRACDRCAKECPVQCIAGEPGKPPYVIDQEQCIHCGTCYEVCPFDAIQKS